MATMRRTASRALAAAAAAAVGYVAASAWLGAGGGLPGGRRCRVAVQSEYPFHFESLASMVWDFEAAGCRVDVFMHARDRWDFKGVMRRWFRGAIRGLAELDGGLAARYDALAFATFPAPRALALLQAGAGAGARGPGAYLALAHDTGLPMNAAAPVLLGDAAVRAALRALGPRLQLAVQGPRQRDAVRALLMRHGLQLDRGVALYVSLPPLPRELEAAVQAAAAGAAPTRHICVQGKMERARRDYAPVLATAAALRRELAAAGERLLVVGRRRDLRLPPDLGDVVAAAYDLPYGEFFSTLARCRALLTAFANDGYLTNRTSSTLRTALLLGTPLVTDPGVAAAYPYLPAAGLFSFHPANASDQAAAWRAALAAGPEPRRAMLRARAALAASNLRLVRAVLGGA